MKRKSAVQRFQPSTAIFCFVLTAFLIENVAFVTLGNAAERQLAMLNSISRKPNITSFLAGKSLNGLQGASNSSKQLMRQPLNSLLP